MADGLKERALVARLRTLRRVVVRVDTALSLAQAALWAVLIAIPVVVALQARRRRARQGLAGPGALPVVWGTTKNVAWKQAIPGHGWSSPIVQDAGGTGRNRASVRLLGFARYDRNSRTVCRHARGVVGDNRMAED